MECLARLCFILSREDISELGIIRILILSVSAKGTRVYSLMGLKQVAAAFCTDILAASGLPTLTEVLRDQDNFESQETVLEILATMAENSQVRAELVTKKYLDTIKDVLNASSQQQSVQGSVTWLIGTLCKNEEARQHFRQNIDDVIRLSKTASDDGVRRKAKSALLALSFDEENMKAIDAKHALDLALSMFNNLLTKDTQYRAATLLKNISEETRKQTLHKLFRKLVGHSVSLLRLDDPDVYRPALAAMANFAMRFDLQPVIVGHNVVDDLIAKDAELSQAKNIDPVRILCLLTNNPENEELYENPRYLNFLLKAQASDIPTKKQLAKLTLAGSSNSLINVEEHAKVQQLSLLSRSEDEVVACKAAGTFALLATNINVRPSLLQFNVVQELVRLLSHPNLLVATQAALSLDTFTRSPHGMELWLKFDSTFAIDAASLHLPRFHEKIVRLHNGRGLFSNWGMVPRETDIIQVMDLPKMQEWTLSLWFVRPNVEKPIQMTLVEGARTKARIFLVEGELRISSSSGAESLLVNMRAEPKGWHHLAISRDLNGALTAYLDGKRKQALDKVEITDEWRFFCNGQFGRQPFAPLCDLRLYRRYFYEQDIQTLFRTNTNSDNNLPDSDIEHITRAGAIGALKLLLSSKIEHARIASAAALANLATKESARREIIRNTVLPMIVDQLKSPNELSRLEVGRLLVNIA